MEWIKKELENLRYSYNNSYSEEELKCEICDIHNIVKTKDYSKYMDFKKYFMKIIEVIDKKPLRTYIIKEIKEQFECVPLYIEETRDVGYDISTYPYEIKDIEKTTDLYNNEIDTFLGNSLTGNTIATFSSGMGIICEAFKEVLETEIQCTKLIEIISEPEMTQEERDIFNDIFGEELEGFDLLLKLTHICISQIIVEFENNLDNLLRVK